MTTWFITSTQMSEQRPDHPPDQDLTYRDSSICQGSIHTPNYTITCSRLYYWWTVMLVKQHRLCGLIFLGATWAAFRQRLWIFTYTTTFSNLFIGPWKQGDVTDDSLYWQPNVILKLSPSSVSVMTAIKLISETTWFDYSTKLNQEQLNQVWWSKPQSSSSSEGGKEQWERNEQIVLIWKS